MTIGRRRRRARAGGGCSARCEASCTLSDKRLAGLGWLTRGDPEIGLPLDSGLSAFPSRARSTTLLARHAQWVVESRGPMHRIDRMRSRGSALWASLAWATRILSGDRVPSRASPVFFNTFLPVRRRTSSAAGATTERQCSLQGAELAPRREEQAGSEVGGRCTPQNALADCSSSQLALWQRRCARAVRCFTLCAGNVRARAAVGSRNECGHAAAARRPLWWRRRFRSNPPTHNLPAGAWGYSDPRSAARAVGRSAARAVGRRLTESRPNSQEVGKICRRNAGHRNSKGRR